MANLTPALYRLSEQQQAVLDFARTDNRSLNLVARAGCGKTSTLLALVLDLLARTPRATMFLGCYNRAIAKEIVARLRSNGVEDFKQDSNGKWIVPRAQGGTLHSAGYGAWKKVAPETARREGIDDKKLTKIMDRLALEAPERADDIETLRTFAGKTVSLAKQRAFGVLTAIENRAEWFSLIDHFGLEEDLPDDYDMDKAVKFCIWLYRRSLEACRQVIDFDDMILAPLYFNARMFTYDFVMIDEAQDTNPARRALAKKMLKPGSGRLIVVGDPAQAIYGFTGADSDSMDIIRQEMSSAQLPLNVTYRCAKSIVRLAQTWVPDITAADSAPEGVVRSTPLVPREGQPSFWSETLTKEDIILCRNTKPLVEMAFALLRRGTACQVEGREVAAGLLRLINRWKVVNLIALDQAIASYRDKQISKWLAKGKEDKAQRIEDEANTVLVLSEKLQAEGKSRVDELVAFINNLFGKFDEDPNVKPNVLTLCTIHRSKGREWNCVYLLGRNKYQPSKYAKKEWQMEQEKNLMYVAVTRAQSELVEVTVQ